MGLHIISYKVLLEVSLPFMSPQLLPSPHSTLAAM
ncbi:hypothetical protein Patl1_20915 [Pistacia atlantica]|uniref:Uncharacterized protein n=1 Tax=Pistacia atlantica TaxID=434234 RepID=A0ACC1BHW9_9ROSI|nr:hypothetical protein Patl1_20915 [Pistacia atlantica]